MKILQNLCMQCHVTSSWLTMASNIHCLFKKLDVPFKNRFWLWQVIFIVSLRSSTCLSKTDLKKWCPWASWFLSYGHCGSTHRWAFLPSLSLMANFSNKGMTWTKEKIVQYWGSTKQRPKGLPAKNSSKGTTNTYQLKTRTKRERDFVDKEIFLLCNFHSSSMKVISSIWSPFIGLGSLAATFKFLLEQVKWKIQIYILK